MAARAKITPSTTKTTKMIKMLFTPETRPIPYNPEKALVYMSKQQHRNTRLVARGL